VNCPSCGSENVAGKKFCVECGAGLALACVTCGASLAPNEKFCGECGTKVGAAAAAVATSGQREQPASERRLVSVLFADLVGFTTLSESRANSSSRVCSAG